MIPKCSLCEFDMPIHPWSLILSKIFDQIDRLCIFSSFSVISSLFRKRTRLSIFECQILEQTDA